MKPLFRRSLADADVLSALEYYAENAPESVHALIDDLEAAYQHIQRYPGSGSPRDAVKLEMPGLRAWKCHQYPSVFFYMEADDSVEIWRVLHETRDIPPSLGWIG